MNETVAPATPPSQEHEGDPIPALYRGLARHAGLVLAAIAALTLAALAVLVDTSTGTLRVGIDPSLDPLMAPDDPEREFYDTARLRFGNDETVLVVLQTGGIYTPESLQHLQRLTRTLDELPGVASASSLINAPLERHEDNAISFEAVRDSELRDPAFPAWLQESVRANPLLQGQLVSNDGRAAAIALALETQSDREIMQSGLIGKILAIADAERSHGAELWVTGAPVVRAATSQTVIRQLRWVVPAIIVLLTLLLAACFRSLHGVLLPLATIVMVLIWTMATLHLAGRSLNLITSLVPPLLVTMGLAYCAHLLSEYESLPRAGSLAEARTRIAHLLHEITAPVILTGATTIIGLLALMLNGLPAITEFALLSALGVFYTVILVLGFVPAALRFMPVPARGKTMPGQQLFDAGGSWLGEFDTRRRRTILLSAGVVFIAATACSSLIRIGDQFVGIFPEQSRVRADYDAVNRTFGGVNPLSIVIDAKAAESFTDPDTLRALERLQHWLSLQPEVGAVTGLVDHVKVLDTYLIGNAAARHEIPDSAELVKQLLFFGDSEVLGEVVNGDHSSTLISLRLKVDDTSDVAAFLDRLQVQLDALPKQLEAHATGHAVLLTRSVQAVTSGQVQSVALSLFLIYLCLALQFASFSIGLLAALPTLLQTALYFGALGLSGITLNATTSLVECLVLGLAVDDTIHYLARFNANARRTGSESKAAVSALAAVLRPVTLTKAMLALGFLMLITGELRNQVLFGWLAAFTLLSAWLVDIFVTPALMSGVRIVTLWDSLRLNLGQNVQATIPLFEGLSTRQARIFALMSKLETLPAGTRVMTEGDDAHDVYVVIEGHLSVWLQREDERIDVSEVSRGAVLGEAGYFGQKRTANVDTMTPVRLLRFDNADQERVCERYPRIAARIFLNLNKLQAQRRAEQIQQVQ